MLTKGLPLLGIGSRGVLEPENLGPATCWLRDWLIDLSEPASLLMKKDRHFLPQRTMSEEMWSSDGYWEHSSVLDEFNPCHSQAPLGPAVPEAAAGEPQRRWHPPASLLQKEALPRLPGAPSVQPGLGRWPREGLGKSGQESRHREWQTAPSCAGPQVACHKPWPREGMFF